MIAALEQPSDLWKVCVLRFVVLLSGVCFAVSSADAGDRRPIAVAVSPDGRLCVSANYTSGSVTLVDLTEGQKIAEHPCGRGPSDIVWVDDQTVLVCLLDEDAVAILDIQRPRISITKRIAIGDEPRAIALSEDRDAMRAFVAVSGQDQVAVIDLSAKRVSHYLDVGQQPSSVAVSPNGRWLVTACSFSGEMFVHDAATFALVGRRKLLDETGNLGVLTILPDSSACIIPHIVNRTFPVNAENIEKGWVIDNRLSKLPLPAGEDWDQAQLGLDKRGDAVGDAYASATSPRGEWLLVTCGGTHELLIFRQPAIPWPPADPGDFIPDELLGDDKRFRRLELGGRPLGVEFIDAKTAIVANYLLNALQVIDVVEASVVRTIHLGGSEQPNLARRGEAIFYDADRSLNSWFSCHTCHTEGHTSGLTFDTLNDRSYNTQKLTPSLRGVAHTAPWTWHGWQQDLHAAMRKSLASTMQSRHPPTDDDARALVAFLSTLDHPENPHRAADGQLKAAARRGKKLFEGKAGCVRCHNGAHFTTDQTFDVRLDSTQAAAEQYNPPSLRGLYSRRRFLHDGRAQTLPEVLSRYHRPDDVGGESLNSPELQDLLAYLKSI
jgi:cytochrome c peroxidase